MILARVVWMLVLAVLGGVCAAWLAGHPGWITARWLGWQIDTSIAALIAFLALIAGAFLLLRRLVKIFMK